jgi:predicted Zn-dependent protease
MSQGSSDEVSGAPTSGAGPAGELYDWYLRAIELLDSGNAAAAAQLLQRCVEVEPHARSLREALARAQFDARMFTEAEATFTHLVDLDPTDHYAQFGKGLALSRQGEVERAVEPLALAVAMRPDLKHYNDALRQARATLRAREGTPPPPQDRGDDISPRDPRLRPDRENDR